MNRAIQKMLANHIPLSLYLIKILIFFDGLRDINCEVTAVAADICVLKGRSTDPYYIFDPRNVSRAVSPICAGREGIDICDSGDDYPAVFKIDDAALFDGPVNPQSFERPLLKSNMYFSIQFFMKLAPVKESSQLFLYRAIEMRQAMNDSISIEYALTDTSDNLHFKKLWFETPKNDTELCHLANGVQSDWTQLIGIKVKVSERKKRATPSGDQTKNYPWMKVGIEYDKHPKSGHVNFYINGKVVHSITTNKDQFVFLDRMSFAELCIANAQFSCIEYSNDRQDASYIADPSLKECMAFYKGKPEKDFVDCEK